MNNPDYHHPRDIDPEPMLMELKEYAVSRIGSKNKAMAIVEWLKRIEERTEEQAELLRAMRDVLEIESERVEYLKEAMRNFEKACKIPEPVWPELGGSGRRRGGALPIEH